MIRISIITNLSKINNFKIIILKAGSIITVVLQTKFQMTCQQTNKPIQLIAFDNNKNPFITEEALTHLRQFKSNNLHIIAVAGKYRTGKSYILNRVLLNKNNGFKVGHTINACTKGLWMWPELIKIGQKDCLIIDTEGLGSLEEGQSTDLKIFLLALLFSSYLVYNSVGNIDEQALQNLNFVLQLANVLQRQDRYDTQQLVNTFPSFLWLLRDFSLKLENDKGDIISPTQYLEKALKHQDKTTPAAQRKNQIRKQIRTFFQQRDCFALVRPTEEERDLQNLSSLPQNRLRPEFVKLIQELKRHIGVSVGPKKVRGRNISIEGFIQLCKYYTKALVDGKIPTISSHWDNLCLGQTHRIFQKYQLEHIKALEINSQDSTVLLTVHKSIIKSGIEAIDRSFLGKLQKQLFKQRFERKLENQYQQIIMKMNHKKNIEIKMLIQSLQETNIQNEDILERYENLMQKMAEISQKSTKDGGHYCQLFLCLSQSSRNYLQQSQFKRKNIQKKLNEKIIQLQEQIQSLKKTLNSNELDHRKQLTQLQNLKRLSCSFNHQQRKNIEQNYLKQIFKLKGQLKESNSLLKNMEENIDKRSKKQQQLLSKIKEKDELLDKLTKKIDNLDLQSAKKDQILRQQNIKSRKLLRQKQIVKNRYQQYLQQNVNLKNVIDSLNQQIDVLQLIKTSPNPSNSQLQIQLFKKKIRKYEQQQRNLTKTIIEQRNTYEAMIKTPQNLNINALKRNLQLQITQKQKLKSKLFLFQEAVSYCLNFQCKVCEQYISGKLMLQHFKVCHNYEKQISFDVTYHFDQVNNIMFQIQVEVDEKKWRTLKNIQEINEFLNKIGMKKENYLFSDCNFIIPEQTENLNQKRRVFIYQLLLKFKAQLLKNIIFIIFLDINQQTSFLSTEKEMSQLNDIGLKNLKQNINYDEKLLQVPSL